MFKFKALHKAFRGVSQSKVKKAKISIKIRIIVLGLKAKHVTINLHFVVPIFCESNTAMSYSSILFQRDRKGKEFCAARCVSVPALTSKPVFTLKLTGLEIFPPNFPAGFLQGQQSPGWVVRGRNPAGTCWEGLGSCCEEGHVQPSLSARLGHVTHVSLSD